MDNDIARTAELRSIAQAIANVHGAAAGVYAVLLCGSVARGWADCWSDIELVVCWEALPAPEVRTDLAAGLDLAGRRVYPADSELRTHEEEFAYAGEKNDLAHAEVAGIAAILDAVTVGCDPSPRKHALVAAVRDGILLSGEAGDDLLRGWQRQAATYPDALRRAMIERSLVFGPHWWPEMLADRDDRLPLHDILVRIGRALLGIVAALNRTYLPNDGFKWSQRVAAQLPIAPAQFAVRLGQLYRLAPDEAVREAGTLIEEVLQLVAEHALEAPVDRARARFASPRVR